MQNRASSDLFVIPWRRRFSFLTGTLQGDGRSLLRFDQAAASVAAGLAARRQRAGRPVDMRDTFIAELDLTRQAAVEPFFATERPQYVFLAAARVGGIYANNRCPADFIRDNLLIQDHVINAAYQHGAQKLLFLGSSCIYPRLAPQPIREEALLSAPLESTNEWYAVAKIAGIKLCQALRIQYGFDAICAMPTNLYGPGDNFDLQSSHVLPALIRKFHEAKLADAPAVGVSACGRSRFGLPFSDAHRNTATGVRTCFADSGV